jgi:hypothetical protein
MTLIDVQQPLGGVRGRGAQTGCADAAGSLQNSEKRSSPPVPLERRDKTGMEKGMKEPYIEGVAIRGGPESCVGVREGAGEALTGVRVGRDIEPRNQGFGVPTSLTEAEGNIAAAPSASRQRTPRGRRT